MNTISKVTLTKVYASDKDKNGNPLVSKTGKPYKKMSIKCVEHGDKWLSGFEGRDNANWKEGDQVEIIVKQNGEYLNYDVPKAEDKLAMRVSALELEVMNLRNSLAKGNTAATPKAAAPAPEYSMADIAPTTPDEPDF